MHVTVYRGPQSQSVLRWLPTETVSLWTDDVPHESDRHEDITKGDEPNRRVIRLLV